MTFALVRALSQGANRLTGVTVIDHPQERAWVEGERSTVALMGTINLAVAELVATILMLIDTGGWGGHGIQSVEHWVTWKAGISRRRAENLTRVARRVEELPECWALFRAGRLTEDAMVRIARRVPASRDAEVAGWAPAMLISQLERALKSCPELPDPDSNPKPDPVARERYLRLRERADGSGHGEFSLPADDMAQLRAGLQAARDAELRDRQGLEADADLPEVPGGATRAGVTWADALVRLATEATDALDPSVARTGCRGERTKVVLHHDVDAAGVLGPGQLHLGGIVPDSVARFMSCDAEVIVAAYRAGQLIGITPTERTVSRNLRRVIERRDQGCAHPLCRQTRWLHIHHIVHWAQRGLTIPPNLVCLCPTHHRQLHQGDFTIDGDPEDGTLRFLDKWGSAIGPPDHGPPRPPRPAEPSPFTPPFGERLDARWFGWN